MLKKRKILKVFKWSGELVAEIVGWEPFTDKDIELWLNHHKADFATQEEQISIN